MFFNIFVNLFYLSLFFFLIFLIFFISFKSFLLFFKVFLGYFAVCSCLMLFVSAPRSLSLCWPLSPVNNHRESSSRHTSPPLPLIQSTLFNHRHHLLLLLLLISWICYLFNNNIWFLLLLLLNHILLFVHRLDYPSFSLFIWRLNLNVVRRPFAVRIVNLYPFTIIALI